MFVYVPFWQIGCGWTGQFFWQQLRRDILNNGRFFWNQPGKHSFLGVWFCLKANSNALKMQTGGVSSLQGIGRVSSSKGQDKENAIAIRVAVLLFQFRSMRLDQEELGASNFKVNLSREPCKKSELECL